MMNRGEPGENDDISFALWDGNKLFYASNWSGVNSRKQVPNGGNLAAHSGFCLGDTGVGARMASSKVFESRDVGSYMIEV